MSKKELLKILDISSMVSIAIATILVLVFEFSGSAGVMRYSLVLYSASFLLLTTFFGAELVFMLKKVQLEENEPPVPLTKKQIVFQCVKLGLVFAVFVFALIILIIY